jgi:Putative DNA-binding domain
MNAAQVQKEALRQQMLLRALWGDARPGVVAGWLRDAPARASRGLQAYRANAGALAERALTAAFPTVAQLVGDESFAALARAFWHACAPVRGDVAQWGAALPAFIAASVQLADEPYLSDVARLDWAVHVAEHAADHDAPPAGLERLAEVEPAQLRLRLAPGTALVASPYPVATIWHAHRSDAEDRFVAVRAAYARGAGAAGESALVRRQGFKAQVSVLPEDAGRFTQALIDGRSLGDALDHANDYANDHAKDRSGADFSFEAWLLAALQQRWLVAAEPISTTPTHSECP